MALGLASIGVGIELQRAQAADGPWQLVAAFSGDGTSFVDLGVPNGVRQCYRLRTTLASGPRSGWSPARCATPNQDPDPPLVWLAVQSRDVELREVVLRPIELDPRDGELDGSPGGSSRTPLQGVRLGFDPGFPGVAWSPVGDSFSISSPASAVLVHWSGGEVTVTLPQGVDAVSVWLQLRDEAGNESVPALAVARLPP